MIKFKDGNFTFYTAHYASWARDARIVFRVREDTTPAQRAEEKEIQYYDRLLKSTPEEIIMWLESHRDYNILGGSPDHD